MSPTAAFIPSTTQNPIRPPIITNPFSNTTTRQSPLQKPLLRNTPPTIHQRPTHVRMCDEAKDNGITERRPDPAAMHPITKEFTPFRYAVGVAYLGFVAYALFLGPGSITDLLEEPGEVAKILHGNIEGTNDQFFALFNLMGGMGVNYMALLNAGAPQQKKFFPTLLFSVSGVFLGFLGLGPYLIGRNYVPSISAEEVGTGGFLSRVLESRWFSGGTVLFSLWCYAFAFGLFTPGFQEFRDVLFYASGLNLLRLISSDRGVGNTCFDFVILSIIIWGPLTEDMCRRGWFVEGKKAESIFTAISFMLIPVLGPALYLATRPPLPTASKE